MYIFGSKPASLETVQVGLSHLQKQLKAAPKKVMFNKYPKNEAAYKKSLAALSSLYSKILNSRDPVALYAISRQNLRNNLRSDFASIALPRDLCMKQIHSNFWKTNLKDNKWFLSNLSAWKTHMVGLFNIVGRSTWRANGTFGNNFFTKAIALLSTLVIGIFEIAGISLLGVCKFLRKFLTSLPAAIFFVVGLVAWSLAWVLAKLYGIANPKDVVLAKVKALIGKFHKKATNQPSKVARLAKQPIVLSKKLYGTAKAHPYLTAAAGLGLGLGAASYALGTSQVVEGLSFLKGLIVKEPEKSFFSRVSGVASEAVSNFFSASCIKEAHIWKDIFTFSAV